MITEFPPKYYLGWGEVDIFTRGVSIVHQGPGKSVIVERARAVHIISVMNSPLTQEILGDRGDKFKATVCCNLHTDSVGEEMFPE